MIVYVEGEKQRACIRANAMKLDGSRKMKCLNWHFTRGAPHPKEVNKRELGSPPIMMSLQEFTDLDWKCINTVRILAADMIQKANSGHPGAPMGLAPLAHVLFTRYLRVDPANPQWVPTLPITRIIGFTVLVRSGSFCPFKWSCMCPSICHATFAWVRFDPTRLERLSPAGQQVSSQQ